MPPPATPSTRLSEIAGQLLRVASQFLGTGTAGDKVSAGGALPLAGCRRSQLRISVPERTYGTDPRYGRRIDEVLAQVANRVQHALRAYTPNDAQTLRQTVSTFPRSSYDLEELLTSLAIGEAVVTVLSEDGAPTPVAWTRIDPPRSLMAPLSPEEMERLVATSQVARRYGTPVDRASAYEELLAKLEPEESQAEDPPVATGPADHEPVGRRSTQARPARRRQPRQDDGALAGIFGSSMFRSFARSATSAAGREIIRCLLGTAPRRRRRREAGTGPVTGVRQLSISARTSSAGPSGLIGLRPSDAA